MNNQNHGENTSQNKQLSQRKKLEGTPFYIIKQITDKDKEQYFLVMGDYRLTEPQDTEENLMLLAETQHWNIVANMIAIAIQKILKIQEQPYETEAL